MWRIRYWVTTTAALWMFIITVFLVGMFAAPPAPAQADQYQHTYLETAQCDWMGADFNKEWGLFLKSVGLVQLMPARNITIPIYGQVQAVASGVSLPPGENLNKIFYYIYIPGTDQICLHGTSEYRRDSPA